MSAEILGLRVPRTRGGAAILASGRKTRRAVVVDDGWRSGSVAVRRARSWNAPYDLDAPVARVWRDRRVPVPDARHPEDAALPQLPAIVAVVRGALGRG